eukprot:SAG22_NODE_9093_length_610_cov_1.136986_2_plen_81_part_01
MQPMQNYSYLIGGTMGAKQRAVLNALIFRKSLRLSNEARQVIALQVSCVCVCLLSVSLSESLSFVRLFPLPPVLELRRTSR